MLWSMQVSTAQISPAHSDALTFALLETVRLVLEDSNDYEDDRVQCESQGNV